MVIHCSHGALQSPTVSSTLINKAALEADIPYGHAGPAHILSLLERSPRNPYHSDAHGQLDPTALHGMVTDRDVMWVDQRMPGNPVISWSHERVGRNGQGYDHTLSLQEFPTAGTRDMNAPDGPDRADNLQQMRASRAWPSGPGFTLTCQSILRAAFQPLTLSHYSIRTLCPHRRL